MSIARSIFRFTAPLLITWLAVTPALCHPAWGIAVDNQGQVYFSSLKAVLKVDPQGHVSILRPAADRHTHEINLDDAGNLYGADNSYDPATDRLSSAIWKLTPSGDFSYVLAPTENTPTGTSIWKDRNDNTYHVANFPEGELLVLRRSPQGEVRLFVGKSSALLQYRQQVPYSIGGLTFGPEGSLFFTHGRNVSKLTLAGVLVPLVRDLAVEKPGTKEKDTSSATRLFGIAADKDNVFVADHVNRRVFKLNNNQVTTVIQNEDQWFPTGVALKGTDLYVLEYSPGVRNRSDATRVRMLSPDGRMVTLATVDEAGRPIGSETPNANVASRQNPARSYIYAGVASGVIGVLLVMWIVRRRRAAHID